MRRSILFSTLLFLMVGFVSANTLYVNMSESDCSDGNSRYNATLAEPFCTIDPAVDALTCGDIVMVATGEYYEFVDRNAVNCTTNTTILTSYPGNEVNISYVKDEFLSVPHALCTNVSGINNIAEGVWECSSGFAWDWHWVTLLNGTQFHVYDYFTNASTIGAFNESTHEYSSWANNSGNHIYLKFSDQTINPNNLPLYVSERQTDGALHLEDCAGWLIENLTVKYTNRGIKLEDTDEVTVSNNKIYGGRTGVHLLRTVGEMDNNTVVNNTIQSYWNFDDWMWEDIKPGSDNMLVSENFETNGILLTNVGSNNIIDNNTIDQYFNGIYLSSSGGHRDVSTEIKNNYITNAFDDGLEIESWHDGINVSNNIVLNSFVASSFASPNCSNTCYYSHNILHGGRTIKFNETVSYPGECFKWGDTGANIDNWVIDHITCYSLGEGIYGLASNPAYNTNITNSIFYTTNNSAIIRAGLSAHGLFFDYNNYYRASGDPLFSKWNNDTGTTYDSLSDALGSSDWDGAWDNNSQEIDPQFASITDYNFTPQNPLICNGSDTGEYLGAIPCNATSTAPSTLSPSSFNLNIIVAFMVLGVILLGIGASIKFMDQEILGYVIMLIGVIWILAIVAQYF